MVYHMWLAETGERNLECIVWVEGYILQLLVEVGVHNPEDFVWAEGHILVGVGSGSLGRTFAVEELLS